MTNGNDPVGVDSKQVFIPNDLPLEWQMKIHSLYDTHKGLTKREYFAACAMQGSLGDRGFIKWLDEQAFKCDIDTSQALANWSIQAADSLIAELNKERVAK